MLVLMRSPCLGQIVKMVKRYRYKGRDFSKEELLIIFHEILFNTLKATKITILDWINKYVPKRTGQLRDSLIDWINSHWIVDEIGLKASLHSDVEYAFDIVGDAAHKGTWFEHSGAEATAYYYNNYGRIFLDDPQALTRWSGLISSFLNSEFNRNIISYKENLMGG